MSGVYVRARRISDGTERFDVKFREGGREARIRHGGTFRSRGDADTRAELIRRQLAAGSPVRFTEIPERQLPHEWVYFIRQGLDGPIKIGVAWNPDRRLRAMQTANPYPLHLLARIPRYGDEEARLHSAFDHVRLTGEWFRPSDDLLAYIREITGEAEAT